MKNTLPEQGVRLDFSDLAQDGFNLLNKAFWRADSRIDFAKTRVYKARVFHERQNVYHKLTHTFRCPTDIDTLEHKRTAWDNRAGIGSMKLALRPRPKQRGD